MKRVTFRFLPLMMVVPLLGLFLGISSPVSAKENKEGSDSTMRLLVQSLSREIGTLHQHVGTLKQLVTVLQKQHKMQVQELKNTVQQQQAALQALQTRVKKLEARPADAPGQPAPGQPAPGKPLAKAPKPPVDIKGAPSTGPADAPITIIEYSDFQCPFCSRGAKTVKQLMGEYKGKIRLVFKHFPLSFHKDAHLAAQASMAAHEQGKFWEYHDKLFANASNLKKDDLLKYAKELGLDLKKFKAALDSGKYKAYVDKDLASASEAGASGTPTFLINNKKVVGAQPLRNFKRVVDAILSGKPAPADEPSGDQPKKPSGPVKVNTKGAPSVGPADAKVTVVAFSDFQCPFCSRGATVMNKVKKTYGKKVRLVFKHLPLSFHKDAHLASQASMAAHAQGKFWEYHNKLFANQRNLKKDDLLKYAKELGLDLKKFKAALDSGKYKKYVDNDASEAGEIGADGTPTFFINGQRIVGAQPFHRFKSAIDAALSGKKIPSPSADDNRRPPEPRGPVKVNTKGAPSAGPADAKVTVVAFSDFQCPFCSRGATIMNKVKKTYGKKVRLVFKHLPLSFHKDAHLASQAAMAAHEQGKFWEYHDKLFNNQRNLKKDDLLKYAKELGLNVKQFKAALDSGKYKKYVDNDAAEAGRIGANGTPTFFVNGKRIVGAVPFNNFKTAIDAELKKKK